MTVKTTGLKSVFIKRLREVTEQTYRLVSTITKKVCKFTYIKNITIFLITTSITWGYLAVKYLYTKSLALGVSEIIVAQTMMLQLCNLLINISDIGPGLQRNSIFIEEYFQYMETQPNIRENAEGMIPQRVANGIRVENVSFSYDGRNEVLHDINMDIRGGEKVAIVGKNGAGKSTLVKLLLQLYRPQSGRIELDGISAEAYALGAYRERFGVAFQNTQLYAVSVAENVLMAEYEERHKEKIIESLKSSGLYSRIEKTEKGIETAVTKEFNGEGIEFSGGQAQKLALARVFARDCGVVILDEPSAALDPASEAEMYENMMTLALDKTVIMISHRLSACRNVDRIYVMEDGTVAESGTHSELLEKKGVYAAMWRLQASGYAES